MEHIQPPTPMLTDTKTTHNVVTNIKASKRLKSMGTRLHWLLCRAMQAQFQHYWRSGSTNLGYYVTKHHAAIHQQTVQPTYLTPKNLLNLLSKKTIKKEKPK